jgi:ubiquinone/menaquinone biosynthesis C-methylase UbiE
MRQRWIYPVPEFYARLNAYILEYGLPYTVADCQQWQEEMAQLSPVLGDPRGRRVLDASCGWGRQTIALAKLGWQVTACDISETSLDFARRFAREENLQVDFHTCDLRALASIFQPQFDWVVSCFALYEIPEEAGIRQAIQAMRVVLKPGGSFYLRLRDMDFLMEEQPRHVFRGETPTPHGRIICIEDWEYESETQVVAMDVFLQEDQRKDPSDHFRWVSDTLGCRKQVTRKADLERLLREAGFAVSFLPQPAPWFPLEIVATLAE